MALSMIAEPTIWRDHMIMKMCPAQKSSRFDEEALAVVGQLKNSIAQVLTAVGLAKPVDLQRIMHLDPTLSYLLFRIANEPRVLAVGSLMPSRVSIEKFANAAAKRSVDADLLDALAVAYDSFEDLVVRHAGDRTSFNSLVSGVAGPTDEWLNVDLQHRRNAFRAMSHVTGVQAETRIVTNILGSVDGKTMNGAYAAGYAGLRVLRRLNRVRLHGLHMYKDDAGNAPGRQPLSLTSGQHRFLIDRYSTSPVPPLAIDEGGFERHSWIQTSLVEPEVGNLGVSTLLFGEKISYDVSTGERSHFNHTVLVPAERLIQDVIIQPGLMKDRPMLRVYLGSDQPQHRAPDAQEIEGNYSVEFVGKGADCAAIDNLPDYPSLVRDLASELDYDIEAFDVWRVKIDFPVYQSSSCISWKRGPY